MVSATLTDERGFDVSTITTPKVFTHIVTLLNPRTGDEKCLQIETLSDSFCDVYREICHQKVLHKLVGYQIFETLAVDLPF